MGFFKSNAPEKVVDGTQEVVTDFTRRTPYWSYRTVPYQVRGGLESFRKELDDYLERLFSGELDDGNGDVLDCLISGRVRQAREDLKNQRISHRDAIVSFGIRAVSDRAAFEKQLAAVRQTLEQNRQELEALQARYRSGRYREVEQHG